jgi:quinol monooxygenase YgiN
VIGLMQFRPEGDAEEFLAQARQALSVLASRPGFVRGTICRATDDERSWLLLTEWESVGAYRRGLGGYQVKLVATPLLSQALDQPSAFEQLVMLGRDGAETVRHSDRTTEADLSDRRVGEER